MGQMLMMAAKGHCKPGQELLSPFIAWRLRLTHSDIVRLSQHDTEAGKHRGTHRAFQAPPGRRKVRVRGNQFDAKALATAPQTGRLGRACLVAWWPGWPGGLGALGGRAADGAAQFREGDEVPRYLGLTPRAPRLSTGPHLTLQKNSHLTPPDRLGSINLVRSAGVDDEIGQTS
jgi:hypothetical protein